MKHDFQLGEEQPLTPRKGWTWSEAFILLFFVLAFIGLCSYRIPAPGLYYDEVLFVGAAVGRRAFQSWHHIQLLVFGYIGALKAWLYAPIFMLFEVSTVSIRLPAIIASCATLCLGYCTGRRILGVGWAIAFTLACVMHPAFVLQTNVDWGPVVLMLLAKSLCLCLAVRWLEKPDSLPWLLLLVCAFGFFDKFNFLWFILAFLGATGLVYLHEVRAYLKAISSRAALAITLMMLAGLFIALIFVLPLLSGPSRARGGMSWGRVADIGASYEVTTTGMAIALLWFKQYPNLPS